MSVLLALVLPVLAADPPEGEPVSGPSKPVWKHTTQLAAAGFPEGAQLAHEFELRWRLWESDNVLLKDAHVALLGNGQLTPSFVRVGPGVRFAPVAVWDVTARVYGAYWWGAFTSLLPLETPDYAATQAARRELAEQGLRTSGAGVRFDLETRLKGKAGPVVLVLEGMGRYNAIDPSGDATFDWYWEPGDMVNAPTQGWVIHRNAYVFVQAIENGPLSETNTDDRRLWVGATAFWTVAPASGDDALRVGPTFVVKPGTGPKVPQLLIGAQAWLESSSQPEALPPYTFVAASWTR
jgi:hypothetical protein